MYIQGFTWEKKGVMPVNILTNYVNNKLVNEYLVYAITPNASIRMQQ